MLSCLSPSSSTPFVIAPPWANETTNPCARRSWQLLVWPADGQCYQIFGRGPCPPTQELAYDPKLDQAVCRCPKDLLYWPNTDRCGIKIAEMSEAETTTFATQIIA